MRTSSLPALLLALGLFASPDAEALDAEAVTTACHGCALLQRDGASASDRPLRLANDSQRLIELEDRIDALNTELRGIDTNWPNRYVIIAGVGYVTAPTGIFAGGMMLLYGILFETLGITPGLGAVLVAVGGVGLVVGLAGLAAIAYAILNGTAAANEARARRDVLIDERLKLERELERLRGRTAPGGPDGAATTLVPVLAF